jgi:signal transduction histidine kinase
MVQVVMSRPVLAVVGLILSLWAVAVASSADPLAPAGPCRLPLDLAAGWEAADVDPPEGIAGLREDAWRPVDPFKELAPRGGVRWYRVHADFTACRGVPLAFYVFAVRDVDTTYLDGSLIGRTGSFPPDADPANLLARNYALPTEVANRPGLHTFVIRLYHGPRPSVPFRTVPRLDRLALTLEHVGVEETCVALMGVMVTIALVFAVFGAYGRGGVPCYWFAAFTLMLALYLFTGHSVWGRWPVAAAVPLRLNIASSSLFSLAYFQAIWSFLRGRVPRHVHVYSGVLGAFAIACMLVPDPAVLYVPVLVFRASLGVMVADATLAAKRHARSDRARAWGAIAGIVCFGIAVLIALRGRIMPWLYATAGLTVVVLLVGTYALGQREMRSRFNAVLEERMRIAREIHDSLAQRLVALSLHVDAAALASVDEPEGLRASLDRARDLVGQSLRDAREAVWELRSSSAEHWSLARHLGETIRELSAGGRPSVDYRAASELPPVPVRVHHNIVQIGREAVTNAVKHARATQIRVDLDRSAHQVLLIVRDDGRGFDPQHPHMDAGCFGLLGMQERAQQIDGRLEIRSAPGSGTQVRLSVPLLQRVTDNGVLDEA